MSDLYYSASVKMKKGNTIQGQTFYNLLETIDTDQQISQFGSAYAGLFDSDTVLTEAYVDRKRTITWSAEND